MVGRLQLYKCLGSSISELRVSKEGGEGGSDNGLAGKSRDGEADTEADFSKLLPVWATGASSPLWKPGGHLF